jgi:hypothetical protein
MTEDHRWIGDPGDAEVLSLANFNQFTYAAPKTTPGKVIPLIDYSDKLALMRRRTLDSGEAEIRALDSDNSHVYIAPDTGLNPGMVIQVDARDLSEVARWTAGPSDGRVLSLLTRRADAGLLTHVYAGLSSSPGVVVKLDPDDMSEVARWTGGVGDGQVNALTAGLVAVGVTRLWAGLSTGEVVMIDPNTMAELDRYSGAIEVLSLTYCQRSPRHVFAGLNTSPGVVLQIDASMNLDGSWTGGASDGEVNALTYLDVGSFPNGQWVFAGLNNSPADVVKINAYTMAELDRWTGGPGDNIVLSLLQGPVVGLNTTPSIVVVLDPATMTESARWTGEAGDPGVRSLTRTTRHTVAGLATSPGIVVPISPTSMREARVWVGGAGDAEVLALAWAYGWPYFSLFAGLNTTPAIVVGLEDDWGAIWEVARWTGGPGDGPVLSLCLGPSGYIFAGLQTGQVVQIDLNTMTEISRWVGTAPVVGVGFDYTYVYAGLGANPGVVVQIDYTAMTEVARWTAALDETVASLAIRGDYLYIGGASGEGGPGPGPNGVGRGYGVLIA